MNKKMFVFISILFSFLVFTNIDEVKAAELIHTAEYQQYFKEYESISPKEEDWYIKKCTYSQDQYSSNTFDLYIRRAGEVVYNGIVQRNLNDGKYAQQVINKTAECPPFATSGITQAGQVVDFSENATSDSYELLYASYIRGDAQYCEGTLSNLMEGLSGKSFGLSLDANTANNGGADYLTKNGAFEGMYFRTLGGDDDHATKGSDGKLEFVNSEFNWANLSDYVDFLLDGCTNKYVGISAECTYPMATIGCAPFPIRYKTTLSYTSRDVTTTLGLIGDNYFANPGDLKSNDCFRTLNSAFDDYNAWGAQIELVDKDLNSVIYKMENSLEESPLEPEEINSIITETTRIEGEIKQLKQEITSANESYGDCDLQPYLTDATQIESELESILERVTSDEFETLLDDFIEHNELTEEQILDLEEAFSEIELQAKSIVDVTNTTFDLPGNEVEIDCTSLFGEGTPLGDILREILTWMQIIAPIALIVLGSLDFGQAVLSGDQDALKKASSKFMKRCIAAVGLFFVPLFLRLLIDSELLGIDDNCVDTFVTPNHSETTETNQNSSVNGDIIHTPE